MNERLVLDTNIFVAAAFRDSSAAAAILRLVRSGEARLVWSHGTRAETEAILRKIPPVAWSHFEGLFLAEGKHDDLDVAAYGFVTDSGDRKFLALAESADATLITNDRHLLEPRDRADVPVLSPGEYLAESIEMTTYRHTQKSLWLAAVGGPMFVLLIVFLLQAGAHPIALLVALIFAAWLAQFYSLTVKVTDHVIRLHFGPGFVHKTLPVDAVVAARRVRNPWYYGWGVRLYPKGWLYNIAGFDAVEVTLESGKTYRIGTDEPDALLAAIKERAPREAVESPK